jgi:hypothetical protein
MTEAELLMEQCFESTSLPEKSNWSLERDLCAPLQAL